MIEFNLYDDLHIQINNASRDYIKSVEDYLSDYVKDYMFMPKFKKGGWNGKISLFKRGIRSFPYGLLIDVLRHHKLEYPNEPYLISDTVKSLFNGIKTDGIDYDLLYKPYKYQQDVIDTCLNKSKGICVVATAGGKSLIIAYIIDIISKINNTKSLIIVPTVQLVDQFYGDLIEYTINEDRLGKVNSKNKQFDKEIVISTWQSMQNQIDKLDMFDMVIVDEVHTTKATKLQEILQNCKNAKYRFGVTGTLPNNRLDDMNVRSYIGPVLKTFRGRDLADLGFISKCTVKMLYINYIDEPVGDYLEIRDDIYTKEYRFGLIKHLIDITDNSILILVEKVEKEGEVLEGILKEHFPNRRIVFLSGRDSSEERDTHRKEMNDSDDMIVIATYPIFQQGVNIKSLRTIILASPTKSFIRVIQSLGRVLRKHVSKEKGGAELYDIVDQCKYLSDHGDKRHRHYTKERHDIIEIDLFERDGVYQI